MTARRIATEAAIQGRTPDAKAIILRCAHTGYFSYGSRTIGIESISVLTYWPFFFSVRRM